LIFPYILSDITTALSDYGRFGLAIAGASAALLLLFRFAAGERELRQLLHISGRDILIRAVFAFYAAMVIAVTILSREPGSRVEVDLMPFSTISSTVYGQVYPIENVLLFIPLGLFLPGLSRRLRKFCPVLLTGFLLSVIIELTQYVTSRGYLQTDDVLLNTLGCVIGYAVIRCLIRQCHLDNRSIFVW